jgi:hypothetical protein
MLKIPCNRTMMIIVCKIVKYGTKMEIKNLTTTTIISRGKQLTTRKNNSRTPMTQQKPGNSRGDSSNKTAQRSRTSVTARRLQHLIKGKPVTTMMLATSLTSATARRLQHQECLGNRREASNHNDASNIIGFSKSSDARKSSDANNSNNASNSSDA